MCKDNQGGRFYVELMGFFNSHFSLVTFQFITVLSVQKTFRFMVVSEAITLELLLNLT